MISGEYKNVAHIYVAAHSRAEASRLLKRAGYHWGTVSEIKTYFSECWGNSMTGIPAELGVWVEFSHQQKVPTRLM